MHCCAAFLHRALRAHSSGAVVESASAPVTQAGLLVVVTVALGGVGGLGPGPEPGPARAGPLAVEAVAWRGGWPRRWPARPRG